MTYQFNNNRLLRLLEKQQEKIRLHAWDINEWDGDWKKDLAQKNLKAEIIKFKLAEYEREREDLKAKMVLKNCETCGNDFYSFRSAERRFCSVSCASRQKMLDYWHKRRKLSTLVF